MPNKSALPWLLVGSTLLTLTSVAVFAAGDRPARAFEVTCREWLWLRSHALPPENCSVVEGPNPVPDSSGSSDVATKSKNREDHDRDRSATPATKYTARRKQPAAR